jgi:hypothetical protein
VSADLLRRAAAKIRSAAPLIEYTTEMSDPTERIKYVQYRRTKRNRWGWRNNVRPALRRLFGKRTSVDRVLMVKWWERPRFAWFDLTHRDTRDTPEVSLDEGNVLIFWSEVVPHIALWTPDVAELVADWLFDEAVESERSERPGAPHPFAVRLARRILGEGA